MFFKSVIVTTIIVCLITMICSSIFGIFFTGKADHVGIVERVENGRVYTIEGNSNNSCKQRDYDINSTEMQGYGTPMY